MVGPGPSLGLPGAAARQKGPGSEERLGGPHAAPPHHRVVDAQGGSASPSSSPGCHRESEAPPRVLVSPGQAHSTRMTFLPSVRRPGACGTAFLFIPAVEINPVSSEPGERHELISYIW